MFGDLNAKKKTKKKNNILIHQTNIQSKFNKTRVIHNFKLSSHLESWRVKAK